MHPRVRIYFSHASTARTTRYERSSRPRRRSLSTRARQDSKSTCSSVRAACVLPPTSACVPRVCRSCTNRAGWTPLLTAAWHGCSTTLIVLLDEYTAEMERANDAGWTPLLSRSLTARGHVVCPPHPTSLCGTWQVDAPARGRHAWSVAVRQGAACTWGEDSRSRQHREDGA